MGCSLHDKNNLRSLVTAKASFELVFLPNAQDLVKQVSKMRYQDM